MTEALLQENSKLKSENSTLSSLNLRLRDRVESLERILVTMKREKFGRRSERIADESDVQGNLLNFLNDEEKNVFNEAEVIDSVSAQSKEEIEIHGYKRKKAKKIPLSQMQADEVRVIDLPEDEKVCPEHRSKLPQVGEKHDFCGQEKKSEVSYDILPNTAATPSLLAHLLVSKYDFALPFYRIERLWDRLGIDITRATMARWTISSAEQLRPLINLMNDDLMIQGYFQCDETHVNVLNLDGKRFTSKSYIWTRYSPVVPIVLYEFHPTRSGEVPKLYLDDFSGYIQVDGYGGYNVVDQFLNVLRACCWQHARKYFYKAYKDEKSSLAYEALKIIKRLFKVDREAEHLKLDYNGRKKLRDEKSKPILDELKIWLDKHKPEVRPTSYLGQAIDYTLKRWDKLLVFLSDGRIELSTNLVENKNRPFALGRKNWLFFDSDLGAEAGCIVYSLIESAKSNGKDPQKYLEFVFTELPKAKTQADLDKLLPYDRKLLLQYFEKQNSPMKNSTTILLPKS